MSDKAKKLAATLFKVLPKPEQDGIGQFLTRFEIKACEESTSVASIGTV